MISLSRSAQLGYRLAASPRLAGLGHRRWSDLDLLYWIGTRHNTHQQLIGLHRYDTGHDAAARGQND